MRGSERPYRQLSGSLPPSATCDAGLPPFDSRGAVCQCGGGNAVVPQRERALASVGAGLSGNRSRRVNLDHHALSVGDAQRELVLRRIGRRAFLHGLRNWRHARVRHHRGNVRRHRRIRRWAFHADNCLPDAATTAATIATCGCLTHF